MKENPFRKHRQAAAYARGWDEQCKGTAENDARKLHEYDGMERRAYMRGADDALTAMEIDALKTRRN